LVHLPTSSAVPTENSMKDDQAVRIPCSAELQ
jgi:hypothetical protein